MAIVEEVWFDPSDDGGGTRIRFSCKPEHIYGLNLNGGGAFEIPLHGRNGLIGHAEVRYIAFLKGLAVLEVARLLPANYQDPNSWPSLPVFSALRPEGP